MYPVYFYACSSGKKHTKESDSQEEGLDDVEEQYYDDNHGGEQIEGDDVFFTKKMEHKSSEFFQNILFSLSSKHYFFNLLRARKRTLF